MLKDITLGQYFPGDTIAHRLDPRTKLLLVIVYIVGLFNAVSWWSYAFVIVITGLCMYVSKIRPAAAFKGLKPVIFIIILTALLNIFYTKGTPIIEGWIITWEGIAKAVMKLADDGLYDEDVWTLIVTTHIVDFTDLASVTHHVYCLAVILNIEPVPDLHTVSIDGKLLMVLHVVDHKRNELLRELIGPIVIRTSCNVYRHAVGIMESHDEHIGRCLG